MMLHHFNNELQFLNVRINFQNSSLQKLPFFQIELFVLQLHSIYIQLRSYFKLNFTFYAPFRLIKDNNFELAWLPLRVVYY